MFVFSQLKSISNETCYAENQVNTATIGTGHAAAAISAIGFGLSSHYLQQFVPKIVDFLLSTRTGYHDALDAQREACLRLIDLKENEFQMVNVLGLYIHSSVELEVQTKSHIRELSLHQEIDVFDVRSMLRNKK